MVCPVMIAANQGSEPILGTRINEVVTRMTPIIPPVQLHHGKEDGVVLNTTGKFFVVRQRIRSAAVPLAKEIKAAWSG